MPKGRPKLQRAERFCFKCEDVKPLAEFSGDGYCKACHRAYTKQWYARRKVRASAKRMMAKHQISLERLAKRSA
jgi:hypothetical protein